MARLTQTQLAGFRIGTNPTTQGQPPAAAARRRETRTPPARPSEPSPPAGTPEPDRVDHPSPLGTVPAAPTRTEARHKVGLTLPLEIAERVRVLTRQGYALADLVMVAYEHHRDQLLEEHSVATPRRLIPHPQGRSPLTVALSDPERAALDTLAAHLTWTRSHTVAALLERQLESMP